MAQIFEQTGKVEKAIPLVERTVEIQSRIQGPYLEIANLYLMELREKVAGAGDKKEGRWNEFAWNEFAWHLITLNV